MWVIRQEQLEIFDAAAQEEFRRRVAAYLRKHLPQQTGAFDDQDFLVRIQEWQSCAAIYGVITERAIAKWCLLSMLAGKAFHEQPEVHQYLCEPQPDPATKIDTLVDALYIRMRQAEAFGGQ